MNLIFQLITRVGHSQKLSRDLLKVLQMLDCGQVPVSIVFSHCQQAVLYTKTPLKTTSIFRKKFVHK